MFTDEQVTFVQNVSSCLEVMNTETLLLLKELYGSRARAAQLPFQLTVGQMVLIKWLTGRIGACVQESRYGTCSEQTELKQLLQLFSYSQSCQSLH